jgi:hypothetical protein
MVIYRTHEVIGVPGVCCVIRFETIEPTPEMVQG